MRHYVKAISFVFLLSTIAYFTLFSTPFFASSNFFVSKPFSAKNRVHINRSQKCIHPDINPFDPAIMHYYPNETYGCEPKGEVITNITNDQLMVDYMKYECWGRCHYFFNYSHNTMGPWKHSITRHKYDCDIIEVKCAKRGDPFENTTRQAAFYHYIHTQILPQNLTITPPPRKKNQYDVHVIVVDSHSHTQAIRNLPLSRYFFKEEFKGVEFPFLNKFGDSSRENLIPIWFGKLARKIERGGEEEPLEPEEEWEDSANCNRNLDEEKNLMKEFADAGYVTLQGDDWWSTLNYYCEGVTYNIAHHSYLPYVIAYEMDPIVSNSFKYDFCQERHVHAFNYIEQFLNSSYEQPKLSWSWLSHIAHNDVHKSRMLDPDLLKLFKNNREKLDNSFIFIFGDHGLRFTKAAATKVGKYDRNNPMLWMSVPKELRDKTDILETMRKNSEELQTHFDIRATMLDILKYQLEDNFTSRETLSQNEEIGHSFFRPQPLPRTCNTLPIRQEFCICASNLHENVTMSEHEVGERIGRTLMKTVNDQLEQAQLFHLCGQWRFEKVLELILLDVLPFRRFEGLVSAENAVTAGKASFKVTASEKEENKIVITSYDRADSYGNRGDCIHTKLKNICDCQQTDLTASNYSTVQELFPIKDTKKAGKFVRRRDN